MSEFIEILSPSALKELQTANAEIVKMISNVKVVNDNMIGAKTPSGSDGALKSLTAEYEKQSKVIQSLQKQLQKLAEVKSKTNARTSEEIVNQRALATNADRQTRATSQLVGAYANLSAKVAIASQRYQDLIVRGKTAEQTQRQYNRELKTAQAEFQKLQTKVLQADKAVDKWNRTGQRSVKFGRELLAVLGIGGVLTVFAGIVKSVFELTKEFDSLNRALALVTQSAEIFTQSQAFLRKTAEDFGVDLSQLTKQYTQFYVSAKDKISSTEIQGIFRSISKAAASMGLSVQQQERAFLALNQMMSKGTIQAEELRGQLGEALPGAFGIMAKAVGVTEQELGKMMKAGELLASDVLPRFAKQLEKTYGIETLERIDSLTASQQRLTVAWEAYIASLQAGEGTTANVFRSITDAFASLLRMSERIDKVGLFKSLKGVLPESEIIERGVNAIDAGFAKSEKTSIEYYKGERERVETIVKKYRDIAKSLEGVSNLRSQEIMAEVGITGANTTAENQKIINSYLTANIKIQNIVTQKMNEEQIVRNKLIGQHIELNKLKQKDVSQEVLFDVAKSKSNEQLKKEIALMSAKTNTTKENTIAKKENNKEAEKEADLIEGSVEWFEKQISKLKELQKQTAVSSEEWKFFDDVIKDLQTSIDIITGKAEVLGTTFEDAIKKVDFSDVVSAGVTDAVKGLETLNKDWKDTFNDIASVTLDAINTVQQAQQRATEKSLSDLQKQRDIAIMFAGDSADAKAEIDRQYEEKRRVILNKQAQQEKQLAIFSSIINTASAVISALKTSIPMAIAVGAIGLAQTALIASQQVPQFWKGTDNAPEGWALTQERGAEVILDKKGKVKSMGNNKGAQMTYLNKGDKVLNASKSVIFNKELNSILNNNSILPPQIINNSLSDSQFKQGINELKSTISNKSEWSYISDRQGERIYRKEQNTRSQLLSNRLRIK